jgi:hypothetical protein
MRKLRIVPAALAARGLAAVSGPAKGPAAGVKWWALPRAVLLSPVLAITASAALATTALAGPAGATVAGANGQIAFAQQVPTGGADVFIANPDGTHVQQVPLVYPAENFGIPRWSPDGSQLLISNVFRFDTSGNLLPFRPGTVGLDGSNFNLLEPPGAPFDMACFGAGTQMPRGFSVATAKARRASSASGPPTGATRCG